MTHYSILRTDTTGRILAKAEVEEHNAGCEVRDGKRFVTAVAVNVTEMEHRFACR
ncbi:MAG: hypothetical protein GX565_18570 [Lentisphaerae bacterium]|nr:hypothetical protein [Lentisphaerota bacterium]